MRKNIPIDMPYEGIEEFCRHNHIRNLDYLRLQLAKIDKTK